MPAALPWVLLALRISGALWILDMHGWPRLQAWLSMVHGTTAAPGLGQALLMGLGVFAQVLCPLLLGSGLWPRLACLPIGVSLAWALALAPASGANALLLMLTGGLAVLGPGPFALHPCAGGRPPYSPGAAPQRARGVSPAA